MVGCAAGLDPAQNKGKTTQTCILTRTGFPPLSFTGEVVGYGTTQANDSTRWTQAKIFKTQGGKYVAELTRCTQWRGESGSTEAEVFSNPKDAIGFLRGGGAKLGKASQRAIEAAAKVDPQFAAAWIEGVE